MADANDDLLDGELEGDFGELDGEEEDALLADDDFMYQTETRNQRSVYIEEEEEGDNKTGSSNNKFYHGSTDEDVQDVAEGDVILEEEEDVLDLGVVDELESELGEGPVQGGQGWRLQEPSDKILTSDGGKKLNRPNMGVANKENPNVSSSTNMTANNVGMESDDDDDEERRGRFKSERNTNANIICLKSSLKKSLAEIPDSLDNVVPAEQLQGVRGNMRGMWRGPGRGNRGGGRGGGFQQPSVIISSDNVASGEQPQGVHGNMRGMWRGPNRGRGFQRPMQHLMPPRPLMMGPGPFPVRPLRQPPPHQNFPPGPKIHINPHFRGSSHQGPNVRPEWDGANQQPNQGPPFIPQQEPFQIQREGSWGHEGMIPEPPMVHHEPYFQPQQPQYQQPPAQYIHHNPEPQVFHNPEAQHQPPSRDRLVCNGGSRITIQTNFQPPSPAPNFEEFPNRSFNSGQFSGPNNNMYPNHQNMPRPAFQQQNFEEQFPPRVDYQEPMQPQPQHQHQFPQEFQANEWDMGQAVFNSPPPQFYGREHQPPPQQQQQMFRLPGPIVRPVRQPPQQQQPQFQSPRSQFRGGIRGRLGTPDKRRMPVPNQVGNEIPFKQARFEQRKGGPVMSNLHEVQTVDNLPPEVLPDTTTEPEEEDEETKLYRLKIEEQKKLREKIMAEKEARRQQAAVLKKGELVQKWSLMNRNIVDDGPPGVDPETNQQGSSSPAVSIQSVRGGLSQRGRGSVHSRIDLKTNLSPHKESAVVIQEGMQPMVTVTSSGIRLPTKYKRVKVRTKDGSITMKRTPVLLDGSQMCKNNDVLTKIIRDTSVETSQQVFRGNIQQGVPRGGFIQQGPQRVQLVSNLRGEIIPVRAQGVGRGGIRRGGTRGVVRVGAISQRGRGIASAPLLQVTMESPKKPLTLGQRFAMQKNQQQIEASQPQTKSNRVVMPTGLVQVTAAINTVPIPNSCLLTIDNLSASTTREVIFRMAQQVGKVKQLKLDTKLKRAVLRFNEPSSAAMFFQRFQRKMVDLSMINVTVVPE